MDSSQRRKLLWGVVLGAIFYAAFVFFADIEKLLGIGSQFQWMLFPLVLVLAFSNYLVRLFRWHLYARNRGIELSFKNSVIVFFAGLAMSVTPGKAGELLKAQYVNNIDGTPRRRTAAVVVAERFTDLVGVLILASFGVFRFQYGEVVFFIVLGVLVAALVLMSTHKLMLRLIDLMKPLPYIGSRTEKLAGAYENLSALLRPAQLLTGTALSVLAWGCEALGFYVVLQSLPGVDVNIQTAFFIYAFAILVGAVTMLPGGLGATEGTMTGLLVLLNVPAAKAVVATLITRLATLWFATLIGILFTVVWRRTLEPAGPPDSTAGAISTDANG